MNLKQLFADDNAVSPVIGVILMVAITVILAAVIGTFVLGMGEDINKNAQAGVSFSESNGDTEIQLTSLGNVDQASDIEVDTSNADCQIDTSGDDLGDSDTAEFGSVGDILTAVDCPSGDTITVKATVDGNTNVVATYTV